MKPDLRARIEAIAAGTARSDGQNGMLDPAFLEEHGAAFMAWGHFIEMRGEPLNAPAELLTPLP